MWNRSRLLPVVVAALLAGLGIAQAADRPDCPPLGAGDPRPAPPPRGAAAGLPPALRGLPAFYAQYLDADGIPVVGSGRVCGRSLQVAREIVRQMVAAREDLRSNLVRSAAYVAVFAAGERITDLPEMRDLAGKKPDPAGARTYDELCGSGGVPDRPTTVCERNLIGIDDPYRGRQSILIHEFGHTLHLLGLTPAERAELASAYAESLAQGRFRKADGATPAYALANVNEYFAEETADWFGAADPTNPACSPDQQGREHLAGYDPRLYRILERIYPRDAWTYPRR